MTMKLDWLHGTATALVTPFRKDGSVDDVCFHKLVERQIKGGVKLLVPCGTTGENVTMASVEQSHVIRLTVEVAKKHGAKVIAGTGTNNTAAAIENTRAAREAGADAALIVAPYYNKPTQEGLFAHYAEIAKSVKGFPIVLIMFRRVRFRIFLPRRLCGSLRLSKTSLRPRKRPEIIRRSWKSSQNARVGSKYSRATTLRRCR